MKHCKKAILSHTKIFPKNSQEYYPYASHRYPFGIIANETWTH